MTLTMVDRNKLTKRIPDWIFQNTNVLQEQKKETDQKSVSSASVPLTEFFHEPFRKNLELVLRVDSSINTLEDKGRERRLTFPVC